MSSDFIVGFPGETEDDFDKMMKLITDVGFDASFSFIFSPRPGTPAANLHRRHAARGQAARLQHLQAVIEDNVRRISASREGTVQRILVEGRSRRPARRRDRADGPHRSATASSTSTAARTGRAPDWPDARRAHHRR
jgi:tRNA-2-methylthio-N6-dimethylallyladenosine synthase